MLKPDTRHPMFDKRHRQWVRQRDAREGEDAIKAKRTEYLPSLDGQRDSFGPLRRGEVVGPVTGEDTDVSQRLASYDAYLNRACFLNATGRTVSGLAGLVLRKDPAITWPGDHEVELEAVGHELESFDEVIAHTLDEVIGVGRAGHLVDVPPEGSGGEARPYIATYLAENITYWEQGLVNGRKRLTRVHLREELEVVTDKSEVETRDRYRILILGAPMLERQEGDERDEPTRLQEDFNLDVSDFAEGPVYYQEVWDEVETAGQQGADKSFVLTDVIVPRMAGGSPFHEITFSFFNPTHTKPAPEKPPLLDLVSVNLSLYRNSADREHGLHFTALPQPWAAGFDLKGDAYIGSGVAWVSEDAEASAGYLEFSGAGLSSLKDVMQEKRTEMAGLGARLLESAPAGGAEATDTVMLRQSGERSALARLVLAVSAGLTHDLRYLAMFLGKGDNAEVNVMLNLDFGVERLDSGMLRELMAQVQAGLLSWATYMHNVRRGELLPDGVTNEDEANLIEAGTPMGVPGASGGDSGGDDNDGDGDGGQDDEE